MPPATDGEQCPPCHDPYYPYPPPIDPYYGYPQGASADPYASLYDPSYEPPRSSRHGRDHGRHGRHSRHNRYAQTGSETIGEADSMTIKPPETGSGTSLSAAMSGLGPNLE